MINWLINSTLCSGLLLVVYQLLLKNTSLFNFSRAYLLLSVVLSLTAPLIVIHQQGTSLPFIPTSQNVQHSDINFNAPIIEAHSNMPATPVKANIDYSYYLAAAYCLVALLLLLRFFRNLYTIVKQVRHSEKQRYGNAWLVLSDRDLVPHTFLNFIFLNKLAYHQNKIEKGVLDHEMAHAAQYHSFDVIFIGLVQCVCWFNPLFILFRKAIQLNHEFIADATAIRNAGDVIIYQELLLSKASLTSSLNITSQFNYSITKKRLIMMTKHTTATAAWCIRLMVIPVIAAAFLLFCGKTQAQQVSDTAKTERGGEDKANNQQSSKPADDAGVMVRFDGLKYPSTVNGISSVEMAEYKAAETKYTARRLDFSKSMTKPEEKRLEYLYQHMNPAQQQHRTILFDYPPTPQKGSTVTKDELASWADPAVYGVWLDNKRLKNSELKHLDPKNINKIFFSRLTDVAVKNDGFHYQIELMTLAYYKKYRKDAIANRNNSMIVFHMKS